MASRFPQYANSYKLGGLNQPSKHNAQVWYYEERGRIDFHLNIFKGNEYQGHLSFTVPRNKLVKSLKRIDPDA